MNAASESRPGTLTPVSNTPSYLKLSFQKFLYGSSGQLLDIIYLNQQKLADLEQSASR
jgi:hypothetical protein